MSSKTSGPGTVPGPLDADTASVRLAWASVRHGAYRITMRGTNWADPQAVDTLRRLQASLEAAARAWCAATAHRDP